MRLQPPVRAIKSAGFACMQELLSQTSHYSEKARKSALLGLADLFTRHPQELTNHVGPVYTK